MRYLPFLFCCLSSALFAAPPAALTLSETEALWQANNRELKLANAAIAGATADVQTAGQIPNPEISYNTLSISPWSGYGAGNLEYKKLDNIVRIEQVIERGDKRGLRVRSAEARLAASRFDYEAIALQQRTVLRRAYIDLQLAQEKHRLAGEAAGLYGRGLEAAQKRQRAGDLAPVEVSRLAVDKARADNDLRAAQSELELAQQQLAYLIGRPTSDAPLRASDDWPAPDLDLAGWPDFRADARPEVRAGAERVQAAERERDLARAARTRNISIGIQYEHNRQNAPTDSIGIGVSLPLFLWHHHEGEIRRAESDLHQARLQNDLQQSQILTQLAQARSALLAAQDRVKRLDGGLLADAERVAQAAELAYAKGAMGLMDLLDARRTVRQVQLEALNARADYAKARSDWQLQALAEK